MDIGKEEEVVTYEPVEDPFRRDEPTPQEPPAEVPDRDRVEETEREKVPA